MRAGANEPCGRLWFSGNTSVCLKEARLAARRPGVFWIVAIAAILVIFVLLQGMLFPFIAAMVLAYVLDAPANRLERLGLNRAAATLLIIGGFIVAAGLLVVFAAPFLGSEVAAF